MASKAIILNDAILIAVVLSRWKREVVAANSIGCLNSKAHKDAKDFSTVMPAKAGIQMCSKFLDSESRRFSLRLIRPLAESPARPNDDSIQ
jgi:hypothetical protein